VAVFGVPQQITPEIVTAEALRQKVAEAG